ncbi:MAG TPA: SGNH/GDSL hydrolase family protein [Myxococcota bacterium]|nr:SGNH/GDSL hydrolase family protein [Myxococcota bacterium]
MARFFVAVLAALLTWLSVEGVWSVAHGRRPVPSLAAAGAASLATLRSGGAPAPDEGAAPILTDPGEIEAVLPALRAAHVVLGNSPYRKLASEEARFTTGDPKLGTLRLKPDLAAESGFLRTTLFAPLDPPSYTVRRNEPLPAALQRFLARYAFAPRVFTTDAFGERTTLPPSSAGETVLVAGDSVAFGQMLGDDEHLASQLQVRLPRLRFVNLGIPGGSEVESVAVLEEALDRTPRVGAVVYVHFDNDYALGQTPETIVARLSELGKRHAVLRIVFVAHHYVEQTMPEIFRSEPEAYRAGRRRTRELLERATAAGFFVIDTTPIFEEARDEAGSLLAGAALYLDHAHLSREGTRRLAERVAAGLSQTTETGVAR